MDIYFIVWVIFQHYFVCVDVLFFAVLATESYFSWFFGRMDIPYYCRCYWFIVVSEHFLTFWHYKNTQVYLVYFLLSPRNSHSAKDPCPFIEKW